MCQSTVIHTSILGRWKLGFNLGAIMHH